MRLVRGEEIDQAGAVGGTAITIFEHDEGMRDRVLIALTDGNDTGSQMPPARAAEIARDKGITVHTTAVGDPTAAGEEQLDEEALRAVAATTGGRYSHANGRAGLADIYTQLDALRTREMHTVSDRPKSADHAAEVEVVTAGQMSDEQLQALWLRRVETKPADFLRAKFAYQLSRRKQQKIQP